MKNEEGSGPQILSDAARILNKDDSIKQEENHSYFSEIPPSVG